jgi:hypothetical protein
MITFYGNCNKIINWNEVIRDLENTSPGYIGPKHKEGDDIPGLDEVTDMWRNAGYKTVSNGGTVAWDMFFPGEHFDQKVADIFGEWVGNDNPTAVWISRIWPGRFAPQHWDVNDDEKELSTKLDKIRFHCHIGNSAFGHVFIVEDQIFYNQEQGNTYKWQSRKLWHAGTNCGLVPKYIFNFW